MTRLDDSQIEIGLAGLEGWERTGESISKEFKTDNFVGSVDFVKAIVGPAEELGHHPDLTVSWDTVGVSITTHSAGGLTRHDFDLARRIDELV